MDEKHAPTGWGFNPAVWFAIFLIRAYQIFLSPLFGRSCRFYPTCSHYSLFVFREWGFLKGFWLTLRRLLRCGPWCEGGYDPPPRRQTEDAEERSAVCSKALKCKHCEK